MQWNKNKLPIQHMTSSENPKLVLGHIETDFVCPEDVESYGGWLIPSSVRKHTKHELT